MEKKEILKALDALKAEVEKKPEDKLLAKLEEILQAIRLQGYSHIHVCPPCTGPHYPAYSYPHWQYIPNGTTITVGDGTVTTGTYTSDPNMQISWTGSQ